MAYRSVGHRYACAAKGQALRGKCRDWVDRGKADPGSPHDRADRTRVVLNDVYYECPLQHDEYVPPLQARPIICACLPLLGGLYDARHVLLACEIHMGPSA